jgi:hypothetical protein
VGYQPNAIAVLVFTTLFTIHGKKIEVEFAIYIKQTDIMICNDSCHPREQKTSSINYLLNRLHTYPMTEEAKQKELYIKHIMQRQIYRKLNQDALHHTRTERKHRTTTPKHKAGYLHIHCKRSEEDYRTLSKETPIKTAFRTRNIIKHIIYRYSKIDQ